MVESDNELNGTEKREYNQAREIPYVWTKPAQNGWKSIAWTNNISSPQREKEKL